MANQSLKIAILAGEASGDILGAGLISAIRKQRPDSQFYGIGGERMRAEGFDSWYPMDRLSVMGLIEPLKRIFELLAIRKDVRNRLLNSPPDVFVGIDSPDFNLSLEEKLRAAGIKVVHYVSPSVWAWRQGRIKKIKRAVDLMLALFPFEESFYKKHQVKVCCVGHALADSIPLEPDVEASRVAVNLALDSAVDFNQGKTLAILPGSRASEVRFHTELFLEAASLCWQANKSLRFLIPAANEKRYDDISNCLKKFPDLPVLLVLKHSHEVMAASDAVMLASGTTALEAMLLKKPMIISYKMSDLAFWVLSKMIKVEFVGLPNLLANEALVPELLQKNATAEKLSAEVNRIIDQDNLKLKKKFHKLHFYLRRKANEAAASAVLNLINEDQKNNDPE